MTDRHQKQYLDVWFRSAKKGHIGTLCKLLRNKQVVDANIQDLKQRTALYLAAKRGKESCVTKLLYLGAEPNR